MRPWTTCLAAALTVALAAPSLAQTPDFAALEASQNAANAKPGPRSVPARVMPVPQDVSPNAQALVAAGYRVPAWNANPASADDWRTLIKRLADASLPGIAKVRGDLGVTMTPTTLGGVPGFILTPRTMPDAHRNQVIFNIHGGGYVYGPGESGTIEAVLLAGLGGYKVFEVDYRMPPDAPYPAAMDDTMAAYKAVLAMTDPKHLAVVGTSTGGGMLLALMLRAKAEGVALPAAIAPGTPWSDLTGPATATR
jgi:monoterpene epsilon-lactone hydrolase